METAKLAKSLDGNKMYQQRARVAFPLLVQLAHARQSVTYGELAAVMDISNPRILNYPLGCVGQAVEALSKSWKEPIPVIQCLVVNQDTRLPGAGIGWFVRDKGEFASLPQRKQRAIIAGIHAEVFAYPRWHEVLASVGLTPVQTNFTESLKAAAEYRGAGESEHHKALKRYVAKHPEVVGLARRASRGAEEYPLPSGDNIDVFFTHAGVQTAVEVKSRISPESDLVRGLFQCVKYRAVLESRVSIDATCEDAVDVILVLEGGLPTHLEELRRLLGIRVIENVKPKN